MLVIFIVKRLDFKRLFKRFVHILKQVMDGIGVIIKTVLVVSALIANDWGIRAVEHRADIGPLLFHVFF